MAKKEAKESDWLKEQRGLNAAAKQVLASAESECVSRATAANTPDDALDLLALAIVAADVESRKPLVNVIRKGLDVMTKTWAELAPEVANGTIAQEDANREVAAIVEDALREAILTAEWPSILNVEELDSISTLISWMADTEAGGEDEEA